MIERFLLIILIIIVLLSCKSEISKSKNNNNKIEVNIKSEIEEFGTINLKKNIIIYETNTILKKYPNNTTDTIVRFYIRDIDGTFNRKIFEILNTPKFGGSTYAELIEQKYLKINRSGPDHNSIFISLDGKVLNNEIVNDYGVMKIFSKDKKYLAISTFFDLPENSKYKPNTVIIENLVTSQIDEYDFSEVHLNGIYIGGFTDDNKFLYICGGRYEFWAPAQLWKIDIENKEIIKYKNLDKLSFPINLYINENLAYINNQKPQFEEDNLMQIDLYQLNLNNNELTQILSESAKYAFLSFVKIDNYLFYEIQGEERKYQYIQMDINNNTKKILFNEMIKLIDFSVNDKWILIQTDKDFRIVYPFSEKEIILGTGSEIGFRVPADNKEYIHNIVGVIKY